MISKTQLIESFSDIKSRILSTLIRLYLLYKTKIVNLYTYYKTYYVTNIDSIKGIDKYGKSVNLIWRLALISLINRSISWLNLIKHYIDIPCKVIESNNNYYDRVNTVIYTPDANDTTISLNQITNPILTLSANNFSDSLYETKNNTRIFSQFMLNDICLKQYLIKYKDDAGLYNHTLTNILLLNKIIIIPDNSYIKLTYFERARKKSTQISYNSVKDKHINFFYNTMFDDINNIVDNVDNKINNEKTLEEIIKETTENVKEIKEKTDETVEEMIEEVIEGVIEKVEETVEEVVEDIVEEVMEEMIEDIIEGAIKEIIEEKDVEISNDIGKIR